MKNMTTKKWTTECIGDQCGRTIIVTGASSGLGKQLGKVLAIKNATVVMAVRNVEKGKQVAAEIKASYPAAKLEVMSLDLTDLASIRTFADKYASKYNQLDLLINNAGVMICPFSLTKNGFEVQMGTNHFGPFVLTGLLLPLLMQTNNSRVVITSSLLHRMGKIDFSDINWQKRTYNTVDAYNASKLANLYFAYELSRRLKPLKNAPLVTIAHPGVVRTDLQRHNKAGEYFGILFGEKVERGVLPTLRAAVDDAASCADFYGPSGFLSFKGEPRKQKSSKQSYDQHAAQQLWELSELLTKFAYRFENLPVETTIFE